MTYPKSSTPHTAAQAAFLQKLVLSSAFTEAEAAKTRAWLSTPKATIAAVSILIDKAQTRIAARDAQRKASGQRRELYRAAKQANAAQEEVAANRAIDKQPADTRIDKAFGRDSIVAKLAREGCAPTEQAIARRERTTQRQFAADNRRNAKATANH